MIKIVKSICRLVVPNLLGIKMMTLSLCHYSHQQAVEVM